MFKTRKVVGLILASLLVLGLSSAVLAQENTIEVGLREFSIDMPGSIPAGMTTFEVTNNGTFEHNFHLEGQGIDQVFDTNLQPGESRTMQVDLQPGAYDVYCPVGNHREQGMSLELVVTEAGDVATEEAMVEGAAEPTEEAPTLATTVPTAEAMQQPTAQIMAGATPTPAEVASLPETGAVIAPDSEIILLAAGLLVLIGVVSFALARRTG